MIDLDKLYDDMIADDKPLDDDELIAEQLRAQPYIDIEAGIFSRTICNKADCSTAIDGDTNNNWCRHHLFTEEGIVGDP